MRVVKLTHADPFESMFDSVDLQLELCELVVAERPASVSERSEKMGTSRVILS